MSLRPSAAEAIGYFEELYLMRSSDLRIPEHERRENKVLARVASAVVEVIPLGSGTVDGLISRLKGADSRQLQGIIDAANPTARVVVNGGGGYRANVGVPLSTDAVLGYLAKLVGNLDSLPVNTSN